MKKNSKFFRTSFVLAISLCAFGIGCGGSSETSKPNKDKSDSKKTTSSEEPNKKEGNSESSQTTSKSSEKKEQKYVDGIPYDVFFDRPLEVASDGTILTANNAQTEMKMSPSEPTPEKTEPKPEESSAANNAWGQTISNEILQGEIKRIRNSLNAKLNSVGSFNRELIAIKIDAATLAALAGIAGEHEGDFTWKDKAKFIRDFSSEIAMAAESRGRPAFEKAEKPFLNIIEILDGGSPAELPEAEDETDFSDVADRNLLMGNISAKQDWIRTTISNEAEMKEYAEDLLNRATVLAALGQVVNREDYVFADEPEYQEFCKDLIQGSIMMKEAVSEEDFGKFEKGFDLFGKSCNACHTKYLSE